MMRSPLRIILAWAILCFSSHSAQALAVVQITALQDVTFPNWSIGDPAMTGYVDVCIYSISIPASNYAVTASSPGGFYMNSGINQLPYSVSWNDGGSNNLSNTGTQLTNNVKLTNLLNASITSPLCALGIGATARLIVKITQADLTAAKAGTYTGTITITVSPT